jgi:ATP-dependent DNA ligase
MKLPTLYKKTSTGADQQWSIATDANVILTAWGQVGGVLQQTADLIKEGKNTGKKNETSNIQQAEAEAQSQWEKKLKKGYVQNLKDAQKGKVDDVIEGGVFPMLAFPFEKQGHKVVYPCYGNPKLDGTRCIAIVEDGKATLWSRTRKSITSLPHIAKALEKAFPTGYYVFDGEAYAAHLNNDFEQLIHLVRQQTPTEGHEQIQYWIYDLVIADTTFESRYRMLTFLLPTNHPTLIKVEATLLESEDAAMDYFGTCLQRGFEGAILRNTAGLYVGKRTSDLIKVKTMSDQEYPIVGIEEGRGKLAGHVGAFVCKTDDGKIFKAKLKGSTDYLAKLFQNHSLWKDKKLTVQYQNLTTDNIPRFPVGKVIRDYE